MSEAIRFIERYQHAFENLAEGHDIKLFQQTIEELRRDCPLEDMSPYERAEIVDYIEMLRAVEERRVQVTFDLLPPTTA